MKRISSRIGLILLLPTLYLSANGQGIPLQELDDNTERSTHEVKETAREFVRGRITDVTGAAVPGVRVVLKPIDGLRHGYETVSDGAGRYYFEGIPDGEFFFDASGEGFKTWTARIDCSVDAKSRVLDVVLEVAEVTFTCPLITSLSEFIEVGAVELSRDITARPFLHLPRNPLRRPLHPPFRRPIN